MLKNSFIVMLLNIISRVLGLGREVLVATYFGASGTTDAYFTATKLTNFFTTLFAEGSMGTAFIPLYTDIKMEEGEEKANEFTFNVIHNILFIFFFASVLIILFSKQIIRDLLGFKDLARIDLASNLLKITAFYLLFVSIIGVISGYLNKFKKFYVTSAIGIVFNLTIIIGTIISKKTIGIYGLGIAYLLSGFFQILILLISFLKHINSYQFKFDYKDKKLKLFVKSLIPTTVGLFAAQFNELIITRFAAGLQIGTISALNYAQRIYLLPVGVFGISLSTVVFTSFNNAFSKKDKKKLKYIFEKAFNLLITLAIPSTIGLVFYTEEIIRLIYGYGKFSNESIKMTSEILKIYGFGMIFLITNHLFIRVHYADKNRSLPTISSIISIIINVILNTLLCKRFGYQGLAFSAISSIAVNNIVLLVNIKRKYIDFSIKLILKFVIIAIVNSFICLFLVEKVNINNARLEIIVKLTLFVLIYFSIFGLKFKLDKKEVFNK